MLRNGLPERQIRPSGFKRRILPSRVAKSCAGGAKELIAGREVEHAVVAEHDRAAMVIGSAVAGSS